MTLVLTSPEPDVTLMLTSLGPDVIAAWQEASKKLEVARLSQRVFERAKEVPGTCDIPILEDELQVSEGQGEQAF